MAEKTKFQLEYLINCSPKVLYDRLSTASGLSEWFADDVNVKGKKFTFIWGDAEQQAEMSLAKDGRMVRFNWLSDEDDDYYFEFRITQDELTGDVSLIIIDFAEADEIEETKELWNTQVADLKHVLGS